MNADSNPVTCPWCGAAALAAAAQCPTCSGSLMVDLALDAPRPLDERIRFQAARALAALGPPAPPFAEAKRRLEGGDGAVLIERIDRAFAARAAESLAATGAAVSLRPWAGSAAPGGHAIRTVALVAGLAAAAGAAWFVLGRPDSAPEPVAAGPAVADADAGAAVASEAREPEAPFSAERVGKLALKSVATVSCEGSTGAGFFVEPELLVTNAHVLCDEAEAHTVRLPDGRQLLGTPVFRDDWLDVARLKVLGAAATPLAAGETAALVPGEPVAFVGAPRGLEFTLHEGKVSFVGRNYLGVGYVQLNATINPGNSGGPVLDRRGRVVGIVTFKVNDAEGIGLALPIEYAQPPPTVEALERWDVLLKQVAEKDEAELARLEEAHARPNLVGVSPADRGDPRALLLVTWSGEPRGVEYRFRFQAEAEAGGCDLKAWVEDWSKPEEDDPSLKKVRELRWLLRSRVGRSLYVGAGRLRPVDCPASLLWKPGTLTLVDGAEGAGGRIAVDMGVLTTRAEARASSQRSGSSSSPSYGSGAAGRQSRQQAREAKARQDERDWRARFGAARRKIADTERRIAEAQGTINRLDAIVLQGDYGLNAKGRTMYADAQQTLIEQKAALAKAQEELRDLERAAANAAVPFEWRR